MRYIPHTAAERARMLEAIGVGDVEELFADIPEPLRLGRALDLPEPMPEHELFAHLEELAARNRTPADTVSFLGAGVYRHYVPRAVNHMLLRGELYTAYTPYQPEVAQGTLQIIFEFQTLVSELLGTEVVNASMYDGATSVAEAALMAARVTRRSKVLVSGAIHPEYRQVLATTAAANVDRVDTVPYDDTGVTDLGALDEALAAGDAACAIVGYPNFFGGLDDVAAAAELCHAHKTLLVVAFQEALAFGLLTPPGELGADIVAGEGQSLGVAPQFGGPLLGLFGTGQRQVRQMPGRLAGMTVDSRDERGFVLTMATREQHIRRERATSNICTNVALMATASTIYMALLGPEGLARVARASHLRSEQAKRAIAALPGFRSLFSGPTFDEHVIEAPVPAARIVSELAAEGIAPGVDLGRWDPNLERCLLVTATELTTDADIAALTAALARYGA